MKISGSDRRIACRYHFKTALRVRIWKSSSPEHRAECVNLSQSGIYFSTNSPLSEGETVEILLKMPTEISHQPTTEWRCTGHVVRVDAVNAAHSKVGIGVQFDCYEIARSEEPELNRYLRTHG